MIKSGFILLLILVLLAIFSHFGLFEFLTSAKALWLGVGISVIMLIIAGFIIGNPFKNK